jgi:hypothetical protein
LSRPLTTKNTKFTKEQFLAKGARKLFFSRLRELRGLRGEQ